MKNQTYAAVIDEVIVCYLSTERKNLLGRRAKCVKSTQQFMFMLLIMVWDTTSQETFPSFLRFQRGD